MRVYQNVILPAGFDCSGSYDSGFTDGFASGRTQGAAEQKAKLISTAVTANGTYTREDGYFSFTVEVPTYSGASYESGYTDGYADGYDSGVTDGYSSGYTSGKTDGYNSGYTNGYDSGNTDGKEEGFESGFTSGYESGSTEGKEEGYESGYTAGEENQKAKLIATSVTANGVYSREDGYSSITVNVPSGSVINNQSKTYQLTKSNTQITKSVGGDYYLYGGEVITPDSGYTGLAKVTVSCIADITDLYNSGMTEGFDDGYSSGYTAGSEQTYPVAFNEGYGSGYTDGYAVGESEGFADGYESGATDAWEPAYNSGYTDGVMSSSGGSYASGYTDGFEHGYESGATDGFETGYESGSTDGFNEGYESGATDTWQPAYNSGYTDGVEAAGGDYASGYTDGYNSGYTVGYDSGSIDGYNSGYTGGYDSGKTDGYNSGYTDGYASGATDGFNNGYTSGKTDGVAEQKAKLSAATFTENGTYTREDGWSAVTVNVSGYSQQDIDNAYASGYTNGYESGWTDGYLSGTTSSSGLVVTYLTDRYGTIDRLFNTVSGFSAAQFEDGTPIALTGNTQSITTDSANTLVKVIYTLSNPVSAGSDDTFWVCPQVVKVEVPEGVTTIPRMFLYMASRLSAVTLPNSLQVIKEYAFEGFDGISAITIPSGVTFFGPRSLYGANSQSAETAGFREIILLPPTPPALQGTDEHSSPFNLTSNGIIYVPDASVNTYKETPGYTLVAERIKGISERPNN